MGKLVCKTNWFFVILGATQKKQLEYSRRIRNKISTYVVDGVFHLKERKEKMKATCEASQPNNNDNKNDNIEESFFILYVI